MSKENKTKTIFRVDKVKGYSIVDNTAANDTRLSYGAIGVMYKALTKPDDWKFYIQDFSNTSSDGITKVSRYFKELRLAGYFELVKVRNELGQIIDSEYVVHEKPLHTNPIKGSKPKTKNLIKGFHRNSENPISGNNNNREIQESVNVKLLNTDNILNTDNNKILTIVQQLKDFAKENNLSYEINPDEDRKSQSKLVTQLSLTNEQVLEQVERLKPILADTKCDWWSKTNSFGFNFMLKNWGRIDSWHNANKPKVREFKKPEIAPAPVKFSETHLDALKEFLA